MTTNRTTHRAIRFRALGGPAALALVAGLALAGCGVDVQEGVSVPRTTTPEAGGSTATDVAFLQGMVPHHRQAVEMAALVDGRTQDPDVLALADQVEAAQEPEIEEMSALLASYGEPVPDGTSAGGMQHDGMAHESMNSAEDAHGRGVGDGSAMGGMMSAEDMASLEAASGAAFDHAWLSMMVEHHEGAVAMSQEALAGARDPEVLQLAEEITAAQETEIATMRDLLARG